MSVYFKAFQLPLRKELADTEIGKKQQVILWYIFKRKKKANKGSNNVNITSAHKGTQKRWVCSYQ